VAAGRRRKADTALILALACGASPESTAQKSGLSVRTVYRRLADPYFRQQVDQLQNAIARRAAGLLTAASISAIKTCTTLQESARSESVRLGAAKAVVELALKLREATSLADRVAALEQQMFDDA
jgi:hypothetical protein